MWSITQHEARTSGKALSDLSSGVYFSCFEHIPLDHFGDSHVAQESQAIMVQAARPIDAVWGSQCDQQGILLGNNDVVTYLFFKIFL